ncbi:MAG TPA: DUF4440 domain-containing protein [Acidimicrobiia bacterium]|jgi:hypothetical protein|nr:DUF4440 domain-containing protein [Acidimicrobiia bacterium]
MGWQQEVADLHQFFEEWFNADCPQAALSVLEAALDTDFSMVTPAGDTLTRSQVTRAVADGYGLRPGLTITVDHYVTLLEGPGIVVGRYVERHDLAEETSERVSQAVFRRDAPEQRLRWLAVHETWRSSQ